MVMSKFLMKSRPGWFMRMEVKEEEDWRGWEGGMKREKVSRKKRRESGGEDIERESDLIRVVEYGVVEEEEEEEEVGGGWKGKAQVV